VGPPAATCTDENRNDAPWGLARLSSNTNTSTTYTYDSSAGNGTDIYIVGEYHPTCSFLHDSTEFMCEDTGVYAEHVSLSSVGYTEASL
jgi:hypothetical protein